MDTQPPKVVLMNAHLLHNHRELMLEQFPLRCADQFGSIWLRKRSSSSS